LKYNIQNLTESVVILKIDNKPFSILPKKSIEKGWSKNSKVQYPIGKLSITESNLKSESEAKAKKEIEDKKKELEDKKLAEKKELEAKKLAEKKELEAKKAQVKKTASKVKVTKDVKIETEENSEPK